MSRQKSIRKARNGAFTLVELLIVIAVISILAALLVPVFAVAREQSRQSSTMANLHTVYVGAKLYDQDNGSLPPSLFGYLEAPIPDLIKANTTNYHSPASPQDIAEANILPMNAVTEWFLTNADSNYTGLNRGFLWPAFIKDQSSFECPDSLNQNPIPFTEVYYPSAAVFQAGQPDMQIVTWHAAGSGQCPVTADKDLFEASYNGNPKFFYIRDSMDIGPALNPDGTQQLDSKGQPKYELHYNIDWTHQAGTGCEPSDPANGGNIDLTQLKYQNPPADTTVLTYITQHVVTANSSKVLILLLNGTVRKIDYHQALTELPMDYQ